MPNTNIYTENPLFTAGVGEDVTATEEQMNEEYKNSPITFREKYGDALFNAYTQQAAALGKQASAEGAAAARSLGEAIQDSMINLGAGAFGGTVDLFAGLAGVGGALGSEKSKELAEWLSSGSQAIYEGADSWASSAQDAQKRAYAARQQALKNRTDRQRREDLANGTSEVVANARHIARNFFGGAGNILEDGGMFLNMGSQALGSMVPSWIASAGIGAAAKGLKAVAAKTVPDAVDTAVDVADASNKFTQYLTKSAPWMAASGAVEGGGAYAQQLQEGLSTPITTLIDHSPEFNSRVAELMKQDIPQPQAQEQARRDLAFAAAEQAGIRTAATAAITGAMTSKLARPFERSEKMLVQRLGEGLTEPLEETLTEGATQYHQNVATRDFLDSTQDVVEGIGQGAAEGLMGGFGVTAAHAAPSMTVAGITNTIDKIQTTRQIHNFNKLENNAQKAGETAVASVEAAKDVLPKTEGRSIFAIKDSLEEYNNKIFSYQQKRDGNTSFVMTEDDAENLMDQLQKDKEIVTSTPDNDDPRVKKAKEDVLNALNEREKGIRWFMKSAINSQRSSYKKNTDLTKEQIYGEARYFSMLASTDLEQAKKEFAARPKNHQEQIRSASFGGSRIQKNLDKMFGPRKVTKVDVSGTRTSNPFSASVSGYNVGGTTVQPNVNVSGTQNQTAAQPNTTTAQTQTATASAQSSQSTVAPQQTQQTNQTAQVTSTAQTQSPKQTTTTASFTQTGFAAPYGSVNVSDVQFNTKGVSDVRNLSEEELNRSNLKESFTQASFKELADNPEVEPFTDNDGNKVFSRRKNGKYYAERNGKSYEIPQEIIDTVLSPNATQEQKNQAWDRLDKGLIRSSGDHYSIKVNGKQYPVFVADGAIWGIKDEGIKLTREERAAFSYAETSPREKADIVKQAIEREFGIFSVRHAETLDPAHWEKLNYYYDSTTQSLNQYDTAERKELFKQVMGDQVASIMVPVKRPISLWDVESPITTFRDFLKSPSNFTKLFRANKHTNVSVLASKLFAKRKQFYDRKKLNPQENAESFFDHNLHSPDLEERVFDKKDPLAFQILSFLHPESEYSTEFSKNFSLEEDSGTPEVYKKIIQNMTPEQRQAFEKKVKEICQITGLHWISDIAHHPHIPTEQELERWGVDPELTPITDKLLKAVMEKMAMADLTTSLRKVWGVSQNNDALNKDFDGFFHYLAQRTSRALIQSGFVEQDKIAAINNNGEPDPQHDLRLLNVRDDLKGIFNTKGDILMALLDPNYKNTWSETPFDVHPYMMHVDIKLKDGAVANIRRENAMAGHVNTPLYNLWKFAAHPADYEERQISPFLPELIGGANEHNRGAYCGKTYQSELGRQVNARLAFEQLEEIDILAQATGRNIRDIPIYYNNGMARNARIMQLGAATPQSNKFLRVAVTYNDDPYIDFNDEEKVKAWKVTLGQCFGLKTSDAKNDEIIKKVDAFLDKLKNRLEDTNKGRRDFDDFYKMIQGIAPEMRETFRSKVERHEQGLEKGEESEDFTPKYHGYDETVKRVLDEVNYLAKDLDLSVSDVYGINAIVEVVRYLNASEQDLRKFESNIALEIDGKNDGPSNINMFLGTVMGSFTPQWATTNFKTGNIIGVISSTQYALTPGTTDATILGTDGNDLHKEVARKKVPNKVRLRMNNAFNTLTSTNTSRSDKRQALYFLYVLHHIIELNRLLGKVNYNPIKLKYENGQLVSASKNFTKDPLAFDREVSKVLTTIIPYGSETRGSSRNMIGILMDDIYQGISDQLKEIAYGIKEVPAKKDERLILLKDLLTIKYNRKTGSFEKLDEANIEKLANNFYTSFPSSEEIEVEGRIVNNQIGQYVTEEVKDEEGNVKRVRKFEPYKTLQNFELTPEGFDHLTDLFIPAFGEPAHSAVTEALGTNAMKGAKSFAIMSELLTIISQAIEEELLTNYGGSYDNLTQKELYRVRQIINKFSPRYDFPSGATAFVRKDSYVAGEGPVTVDPVTGVEIYSTYSKIESSGVSGSPLAVQAMGDASNILYAISYLQREGLTNVLKVFDGVYVHPNVLEIMGALLNESMSEAQRQLVFQVMENTKNQIAKNLKQRYSKLPQDKSADEIIKMCVANYLSGSTLDGNVRKNDKDKQEEVYRRLHASIDNFFEPKEFEGNMSVVRRNALGGKVRRRNYQISEGNIKNQLLQDIGKFLREVETITLNEEVQHEALDALPKTIHHMSGTEYKYLYKLPPQMVTVKKILDRYNSLEGVKPFKNYAELISAFLNRFVREEVFPKIAEKKELTQDQIDRWMHLTQRNEGNSGYIELTNDEIYNELKEIFDIEKKKPFNSQNKSGKPVEVDRAVIKIAFDTIGKKRQPSLVYTTLFNKIQSLLPKDTRIFFAKSKNDLPEKYKNKFVNDKQRALFVQENGESRIYILDDSTAYDAKQIEIAELIAHEAIHASIGHLIQLYYNGSGVLTNEQRSAIQHLERLLEDFMNEDAWQGDTPAPQIVRLREILFEIKNPAERLDEALAYICSNGKLFNALAERNLKDDSQHRKDFWKLLKQVVMYAHKVWKKLVNIVTNSPLDKRLTYDETYTAHKDDPIHFLEYWGVNTLILVNAEQQIDPKERLKRKNKTANVTRAASSLEPGKKFFRKSNFFKSLRNRMRNLVLFDTISQKGMLWGDSISEQKVDQAYKEELNKILKYKEALVSMAKNFLDNPEDFADTVVSLMDRDAMTSDSRNLLHNVRSIVRDNINEYSFVEDPNAATQEELNDSVELYNLIEGSSLFYDRIEGLKKEGNMPKTFNPQGMKGCIFMALALTQDRVSNSIGKIQIDSPKKKGVNLFDPLETLSNLSDEAIANWTRELANNKTVSDSVKIVLEEGEQLIRGTDLDPETKGFFHNVDKFLMDLISGMVSIFSKEGGEAMKGVFDVISQYPVIGYMQSTEVARNLSNQFKSSKVAEWVKDIYGRSPSLTDVETSFKRVKGYLDRWRKDTLEEDPELLKKQFKNHKITAHLKRFLHRTILRTGIHTLDEKVAQKVLTNEGELDLEIDRVGNQIKELSSDYGDLYIQKCRQLANYLTGNRQAGHNLLTSPEAISRLLGETSVAMVEAPEGIVPLLGQMISLLSIKNFTEGDKSFMQDLFKTDTDAMLSMIRQYKEVMAAEERKVAQTKNKYYPYNYLFGWMPKGASATGRLVYATRDQVEFYEKQGYTNLGRYQNSNIDPSEPVFRMYCKHPLEQEYQEGLFQGINQTSKGMLHKNLSRNEMEGTIVQDASLYGDIYNNFDKESTGNGLIPIYDDEGFVIGYERSVMPEDRVLIEDGVDFFSAMAQMKTRQDREIVALDINKQAVKMAWDAYNNAPDDYKKNFIDVMHVDDPNIKKALARLDWETKNEIKKYFGDHLYLLADEVNTYLGYPRPKLTDLWDNGFFFPKGMQQQMVKCLEALFGKKALYYVGRAEEVLNIVVSYARDTIIIRSGVVPLVNALSNTLMLWLVFGIPLPQIAKYYTQAVVYTNQYNRKIKQQREYQFKVNNTTDPKEKAFYEKKIERLQEDIEQLPIYRLIQEGEYSTISAEGAEYEGANYSKAVIDEKFNAMMDTFGKGEQIKNIVSNVLMTKNSMTYQTMNEMVNMSDWAAKCAGYWYLTEHSSRVSPYPIDHDIARNLVSTLFVDYDQLAGRARDYLNRTGLTWFLTYKYRMIAASLMVMHLNPSRTIMGTIMESVLPTNLLGGTPLSENLLSKILSGDISYSLAWDMMFRGLLMHPAALFFGLLLV